jgi:elongation factor P
VTLTITEADPVVKGQTAASSYKPAVLENGVRVSGAALHRRRANA